MKFKVAHKIFIGYIVGLLLFLTFSGLTLFNGQRINTVTHSLAETKLPGLVAIANLKSNIQSRQLALFELYATADSSEFNKKFSHDEELLQDLLLIVSELPEYLDYQSQIMTLITSQQETAKHFVLEMTMEPIDWDNARTTLSNFSRSADETSVLLNTLSREAELATLTEAKWSSQLAN